MTRQSILAVGNVVGYTGLICHSLIKGYRILYTKEFKSKSSFLNQERIRLVIVGKDIDMNPGKSSNLVNFIESDIPVILTKGNELEGSIMEIFQNQCHFSKRMMQKSSSSNCPLQRFHASIFWENSKTPVALHESKVREDIDDTIECFFNKSQRKTTMNNYLIFTQEKDFIFLELNEDGDSQRIQERIKRAILFMEKHYNEEIFLNQIAHAAYLSSYYFSRLFKEQIGTTCIKYLSNLRVKEAKRLLKETEFSVTKIGFKVGFNSLTHFERVFKRLEGTTPSTYRQSY